ncbi:MAG TPA: hypothetical protein V6C81_15425 [Planktothrix sp.]|jgi:hypothetical protein
MATPTSVESAKIPGPSGFIELNGQMLIVDYGKINGLDGTQVGFLYEDGYIKETSGLLGDVPDLRPIEDVAHCVFRGIDSKGLELELPGPIRGPSGALSYNNVPLHVINGRLCTSEHGLAGHIDDKGTVYVRDWANKVPHRKLDEATQLTTSFSGYRAAGDKLSFEFIRKVPGYRRDKSYADNEIIRYFKDFDAVNAQQKKYVLESLNLWSASGLLQIVRRSEGDAALGNVKHGAAGVTAVRTGMVHLDKEEFEKEVGYFKQWGTFAVVQPDKRMIEYLEVRINLVVAHEFGHQLEFVLSQKTQKQIEELYERKLAYCMKAHPLPSSYPGQSELLQRDRIFKRDFVSGYARSSFHEYWAEAVAAFSTKEGRAVLKQFDPAILEILREVVFAPQTVLRPVFHDTIMELQASLRMGGEFHDKIIED